MSSSSAISVLVVDDSPLVRRALRLAFSSSPDFVIVGEATNGREAIDEAKRLAPRLITIDVQMPEMDGIEAIAHIMAQAPTRILVITSEPHLDGRDLLFEALARGALDLVQKPTIWPSLGDARHMLELARRLADIPVVPHVLARQIDRQRERHARETWSSKPSPIKLVVLGASTGGPRTLQAILSRLPADLPVPVVIVQHLSEVFSEGFISWLGAQISMPIHEAVAGTRLLPGNVYMSVRGPHIVTEHIGLLGVDSSPPRNNQRPSVDFLFESVACVYRDQAIGVLLSGMGTDGAEGLSALSEAGAVTIAQDEGSSVVFGMPKAAIDLGAAKHVLARDEIPDAIVRFLGKSKS